MSIILLVILLAIALLLVSIYNGLVSLRQRVKNAWSQIDVQLKRRYDLIPNLVETVKGYAAHEKETFEMVTRARAQMASAKTVAEQAEAQNAITGALRTLFAVAEAYPDLKANQNFMMLQEELAGTENKIAYARQFYNDTVMKYNTMIQSFPSNIIAGMFGFKQEEFFEIEESSREPVKVKF
ncbi:MAG: LemA family protein [Firmicutes bacterium]|nr:LemA family protein [Bacillota bacterium]